MRVKDLREALKDVDDEMIVLLRVQDEDGGEQFMCSPNNAIPDPGCTDIEMFVIDGIDGECEHEFQAHECSICQAASSEKEGR